MSRGLIVPVAMASVAVSLSTVALIQSIDVDAPSSSASTFSATATPQHRPRVAFLGDSFTDGSPMDSGLRARWRNVLCRDMGCEALDFAVGGSGYVHVGQDGHTLGERVPWIVATRPDGVVVAGGINDLSYPVDEVAAAASSAISRLREGLPQSTIVVLSPFWPRDSYPWIEELTDRLETVAQDNGAVFVDVRGLFVGPARTMIGTDGTHPTDAGHLLIERTVSDHWPDSLRSN